jgi:hypothetical protein
MIGFVKVESFPQQVVSPVLVKVLNNKLRNFTIFLIPNGISGSPEFRFRGVQGAY